MIVYESHILFHFRRNFNKLSIKTDFIQIQEKSKNSNKKYAFDTDILIHIKHDLNNSVVTTQ